MSSAIDICNLALAHLGDEATVASISPPESSPQAEHCARYYPIARQAILELHSWGFATRRTELAELVDTPSSGWMFTYGLPSQCLKPLAILPFESIDTDDTQDFAIETLANGVKVLYSNTENAVLIYTVDVTDPTKFTPLFVTALARLLASYLAGPLIKGTEGMKVAQLHMEMFVKFEFPQAKYADANTKQTSKYDKFIPSSVAARL